MRVQNKKSFRLTSSAKEQLLQWSQQFDEVVWLDSNHHQLAHHTYKAILAVDACTSIKTDSHQAFEKLNEYQQTTADWLFGYLSYDLKNDVEALTSNNIDGTDVPDLYFFQPKRLFLFTDTVVEMHYLPMVDDELDSDWEAIHAIQPLSQADSPNSIKIRLRTTKDQYFEKLGTLLQHIDRGDIYEANFCQEFYAENVLLDTVRTFIALNELSVPPFATFLKLDKHYALSASPERYLMKQGKRIVSQPIKGTAKRCKDPVKDAQSAKQLLNDPKERSENIIIADLVRNDLSRIASKGTVKVEALCELQSFQQVHQLVTTVVCEVPETITPVMVLKNSFPMGSMTGAPKISAMKIIEELEVSKRGLYSGAIGYFTPKGDFDFNVVIRSILYNAATQFVSYSVGGAITAKSVPEKEYEECLLKAKAMREVLEN